MLARGRNRLPKKTLGTLPEFEPQSRKGRRDQKGVFEASQCASITRNRLPRALGTLPEFEPQSRRERRDQKGVFGASRCASNYDVADDVICRPQRPPISSDLCGLCGSAVSPLPPIPEFGRAACGARETSARPPLQAAARGRRRAALAR